MVDVVTVFDVSAVKVFSIRRADISVVNIASFLSPIDLSDVERRC